MKKVLHILILEDEPADAELMKHELRKANISLISKCVETKKNFIKELQEFCPDIILVDYQLSYFSGLEALNIAQKKYPEIPFIFVSGVPGEERAIEAIKTGATDYVLKQHLSRLPQVITRILNEFREKQERKHAEENLKRYQYIVESANDAIFYKDLKSRYIVVNNKTIEVFGLSREEILGKNCSKIGVGGGLTQSPVFLQILADVLDRTVQKYQTFENTALGAAICAAMAATLAHTAPKMTCPLRCGIRSCSRPRTWASTL